MSEDDQNTPSSNGSNGRGNNGRFLPGNPGGPGSPVAKRARELRDRLNEALSATCSPSRLVNVANAILVKAEAGDVQAAKLLFERLGGPPINTELDERLDALEMKFRPITFDGDKEIDD